MTNDEIVKHALSLDMGLQNELIATIIGKVQEQRTEAEKAAEKAILEIKAKNTDLSNKLNQFKNSSNG